MRNTFGLLLIVVMTSAGAALLSGSPARAGGPCTAMTLVCENGHRYPLCPVAVTDSGDLVTGHLKLSARHAVHVRLVPSGIGYRYIGRGLWFDGLGQNATLNFGVDRSVACTVAQD
jgi:hypothetical protein